MLQQQDYKADYISERSMVGVLISYSYKTKHPKRTLKASEFSAESAYL